MEILDHHGRLLCGSKSAYRESASPAPGVLQRLHLRQTGVQICFGDLELSLEPCTLEQLTPRLGADIYVTSEQPGRIEGLKNPTSDDQIIHLSAGRS